jgi:hypothetical protein
MELSGVLRGAPDFLMSCRPKLGLKKDKKQGATGITTVAPYIAGQWGRGDNRLPG